MTMDKRLVEAFRTHNAFLRMAGEDYRVKPYVGGEGDIYILKFRPEEDRVIEIRPVKDYGF